MFRIDCRYYGIVWVVGSGVGLVACGAEESEYAEPALGQVQAALTVTEEVWVTSGSNDAEESASGSMSLSSTDLELVTDGSRGAQWVGMRFLGVNVPNGAAISNAYIEFVTDETNSGSTSLTFRAQDIDDAPGFTSSRNNISNRTLTSASVPWVPAPWNTVGQAHQTPDLSVVVQEVVNRGGWSAGNDLVFVATGSGERTAESYNGVPGSAPMLHIEYDSGAGAPMCGDGTCNGSETCSSCAADCGSCASCSDGVQNQGETGVDCGGPCPACSGTCSGTECGEPTEQNLLVAFIGDQGNNGNSTDVLELIRDEGADAVVHNGDFDYQDNPTAWDNRITSVLGSDYPYFAVIGNHDAAAWGGSNGYAAKIQARHARNSEMVCTGELGVRANCTFRGLHLLQSCIGTSELRSSCGANSSDQVGFLRDSLGNSNAMFKVCSWHKNQRDMQVGSKSNEVGWNAYQECMDAGAIVSTGHEHSYARTLTLTDVGNASAGHGAAGAFDVMTLTDGQNFVFVSGLAGVGIRSFSSTHNGDTWWASYYASNRWYKNGFLMSGGADYGALFIRFYVDGDPARARGYFKDVNGRIADEFVIQVQ